MALTIKHTFVSAIADGADATVVRPSNWNATHTLTGSIALNEITAATGANTIASGNNTGQVWNWANTVDSTICLDIGETTAATNGTTVSGTPNQVLLKLETLASSTMSPLQVFSRGSHIFSVSATTQQIFVGANVGASAPAFAAAGSTNTGMFLGNNPGFAVGGVEQMRFNTGVAQFSFATAVTTSYAMNFRKSRGTVASPTVITTGDVLMTQSAFAYLGATNTYRETGRIEITSKGTISDATTGVGSILTLYGKTQGTDVTVQPTLVITDGSTATIKFAGTGMFTANATTACAITAVGPAGANTTVQTWLTITDSGGTVRYIPCF